MNLSKQVCLENNNILEKVAENYLTQHKPPSTEVVKALLIQEKLAKKNKITYSFTQLIGNWRLCFVTGIKKTGKQTNIGKGKYLPSIINISLNYAQAKNLSQNQGRVSNCVKLPGLELSLTGPVKFLSPKNILAFDFTTMYIKLFGLKVYQGYIRGGKKKEESFYQDKINQQAFFSYFYLSKNVSAARGKGGGLAIWIRVQ